MPDSGPVVVLHLVVSAYLFSREKAEPEPESTLKLMSNRVARRFYIITGSDPALPFTRQNFRNQDRM